MRTGYSLHSGVKTGLERGQERKIGNGGKRDSDIHQISLWSGQPVIGVKDNSGWDGERHPIKKGS